MATKKELLEKSQNAIAEYFKLSAYLLGDDAPFNINEIPVDSPYHQTAKDIVDEMGLDWDTLPQDRSNGAMLNLMAEYFFAIQPDKDYEPVLTITYKKSE